MTIEYGKSEYGSEFPLFNGQLLSWALDMTLRDEQEGFPRLRTVIRAMVERRPQQLERERIDMVKGSLDPAFGHNAKKCLQIIDEELAEDMPENDMAPLNPSAVVERCNHQFTESEFEYYENRRHLDRLCKRCVAEGRAR